MYNVVYFCPNIILACRSYVLRGVRSAASAVERASEWLDAADLDDFWAEVEEKLTRLLEEETELCHYEGDVCVVVGDVKMLRCGSGSCVFLATLGVFLDCGYEVDALVEAGSDGTVRVRLSVPYIDSSDLFYYSLGELRVELERCGCVLEPIDPWRYCELSVSARDAQPQ